MSTVTEIIEAVKKLPEAEKGEFLQRLSEVDFDDNWDRQIEADAKEGRLNLLWAQALGEIEAGRTKPLKALSTGSGLGHMMSTKGS